MSIKMIIFLVTGAIFLMGLSTYFLRKGRIPEKYALLWYAMSLVLLLLPLFPNVFTTIATKLGFYPLYTFIFSIFIVVIIILLMALTIMIAGQNRKTTMIIQEISLQNYELRKLQQGRKD